MSTKTEIMNEAMSLYAEKGYEGMTMKEIAKRVGVTAPAVYAFFDSKADLFIHICKGFLGNHFQIAFDQIQKDVNRTAKEKFEHIVREIFNFQMSKPVEIKVFIRLVLFPPDIGDNDVLDEFQNLESSEIDIFRQIFKEAIDNDEIREGETEIYADALILFMDGLFWQMQRLDENTFWQRFDRMWAHFWRGLE